MVGARDSVPSLGPLPNIRPLPEPGRGGGVTSIGFGGFGDGAADEDAVVAFGVVFLVGADCPCVGKGACAALLTVAVLLFNVKCAGTGAFGHDSDCFSSFGATGAWTVVVGFIIGEDVGRLDVGDGGTE